MKWYVARTEIAREFSSARNMIADGIEVYCPTLPVRGAHPDPTNDDPFAGKTPMLGRYVFVRPADHNQLWAAAHTRGVEKLMGGLNPIPVTDQAIALVRQTEAEEAVIALAPRSRAEWMPKIGMRVRVISGSYVGEWIKVVGGDADKGIVHGLAHIFAALRPVWINVEALDRETARFEEDSVALARRPYLKREGRQKPAA